MKKSKKILALLLASILCFSSFHVYAADTSEEAQTENIQYEQIVQVYLAGNQMEDWVVEARKEIAKELGLLEYLDECSFLSVEYRNEQKIGRDGAITDKKLDLLVEMATQEEMDAILMKSMVQTFATARAITSGQSVGVTQQARVSGAGNGYFTISGANSYGYCAQNSMDFWSNGGIKYGTAYEWNDATARKVLYYGPGGPGYAGPYYGSLGADMDYATYAVGKLNGDCNNNTKATAYINKVSGYADPLSSGYRAYKADIASPYQDVAFLAYAPVKGTLKVVKTSSETIAGNATDYYSLEGAVYGVYSNAACTTRLGTLTTNASGVSGTISLDAGTYYVKEITAPKGHELNTTVYTAVVSAGGAQTVNATDLPLGTFLLRKYSANPELTENNVCYSLEGAEYTIYYDYECTKPIQTITTGSDGKTSHIYLAEGTYFVKETKAPKGFALDTNVYPITITYGNVTYLDVSDIPQMDPVSILLGKIDAETNSNKPSNSLSLQGAQFTVKYYGVLLEDPTRDPAWSGYDPVRTWVLETNENGHCYLSEDFLVSGDEFFENSTGEPSLPVGTITIQETKAPEGYMINSEVFVRQILPEGTAEWVETYNYPTIQETQLKLAIIKRSEADDSVLYGAEFTHIKPDGTSEVFTINEETGVLNITGLTHGTHTIYESKAPKGYAVNKNKVQFVVSEENKISYLNGDAIDDTVIMNTDEDGNGELVFYDDLLPLTITVNKLNDKGTLLDGAEFTLYDSTWNKVGVAETMNGTLTFENLEAGKTYYLSETKAPAGYMLPNEPENEEGTGGGNHVYTIHFEISGGLKVYVACRENPVWSGNGTLGSDWLNLGETFKTASFDADDQTIEVSFDIVNEEMPELPSTGSDTTIPLTIIGAFFMLSGILITIKRKKENKRRKCSKKLFSFFMVLSLGITGVMSASIVPAITAEAEETVDGILDFNGEEYDGGGTIIIQGNEEQSLIGKKFNLYRLFIINGTVGEYYVDLDYETTLLDTIYDMTGEYLSSGGNGYEIIKYMNSLEDSELRTFIETLRDYIENDFEGWTDYSVTVASVKSDNSIELIGLSEGYYLIDEVSDNKGSHSASSLCMLNTAAAGEVIISIKSDYPTVEKKIKEDDNNIGWNDIADYEIGQTVPYKFESNVPNMNGYSEYYYAWHDVMDEALSFHKNSVGIVISDGTKEYELASTEFTVSEKVDNTTFKVEIADLKAIVDREFDKRDEEGNNTYGQTVALTYDATLNDKAAKNTGRPGFENEVRLEFSNDPDSDGKGKTGFTPWDTVVCFTYTLNVSKVNSSGTSLENVKFRLYSNQECTNEVYVKKSETGYIVINKDSITGEAVPSDAVEMSSDVNGKFIIYGLDGGIYWLKETEALANYKKLSDPIELTVTPTFTEARNSYEKGEGATEQTLVTLEYKACIRQTVNGAAQENTLVLENDVEEGSGCLTVVNHAGKNLPITGSATMLLVLGAGIALMTGSFICGKRKRTTAETD